MSDEHHINVSLQASYYTQNKLTEKTKRVWLVFHGYGQLSKYFLRKFSGLNPDENYLIAPQGLSKFYLEGFTGKVGATWMTKEDRLTEIANQYRYIDSILVQENMSWNRLQLVYFGFSQGVATMCRYAAHARLAFSQMILWAGGFPPELQRSDFDFLSGQEKIGYFTGLNDPFYKPGMKAEQLARIREAMATEAVVTEFEGKHELIPDLIKTL